MISNLDRAIHVLDVMSTEEQADWSIADLQKRTEYSPATLHRYLTSWVSVGFVSQDPRTRRYRLGMHLMDLGLAVWRRMEIRQTARPVMERVAVKLYQSIYLTIRDGLDGVHIERVDSPSSIRLQNPIGHRLPLHCGCSRKILMAFLPPAEVESIIERLELRPMARGTVTDRQHLLDDLAKIRRDGYGISFNEVMNGSAGVAAPIWDHEGRVVAGLMAAGLEPDYVENQASIVQAMVEAAAEVSALIGGRAPSARAFSQ